MQCSEFHNLAGGAPQHLSPLATEHAAQCPACNEYLQQLLKLDGLLKRALEVPLPVAAHNVTALRRSKPAQASVNRGWALAASVLLAVVVGVGVWLAAPRETLAADVVEHMQHEIDTMVATDQRVAASELEAVLRDAGVRLKPGVKSVSVARSCPFHGRTVPHLVVQTQTGPVTVLILASEPVKAARRFEEQGYRGTILPSGTGSIAVIAANDTAIEQAQREIAAAIEWVHR